ncbi:serine hydrolase domain-containing protein [uncultured Psychrobacter sp.]|uniref:serine hydrolase domain-containing protein n=1 Tax=uncultured Psychrobacter sp. TaxID=259303 RepID=UPI0034598E6F
MNKKLIVKNGLVVFVCMAIIFAITYIYTAQHKRLSQLSYRFQLSIIKSTVRCSENAPAFMNKLMDNLINEQKSMSNQIVYQDKNNKLFHCESGWEDGFRGNRLLTVDSRFRYASVSKVITSAITLNLINQNKLRLNQKLLDVIAVSGPKDKRLNNITIAMLLEHSAGFDRFKTYTPMLTMGVKPWCPTDLNTLANVELDFDPNTQFQYSNVGYCLLGAVIEQVTGNSFRNAVNDIYHFDDRGIKFVNEGFLNDEITYDYRYENFYGSSYPKYFDFKDSLSAVGGLSGSAKSIVLLTRDMLSDQPLNILSRANTPCAIDKIGGCYGYALEPYQKSGYSFTLYNKSGFFPGVNTDIFVDDQGGILALYRGASAPNHTVKKQLKEEVYTSLENHYELDRK